jgi:hypothetical protein
MKKYIFLLFLPFILACGLTPLQQSPHPAPKAGVVTSTATAYPVGDVVARVNIRNTPKANGNPSHVVEYPLRPGSQIQEFECLTVGNSVWVRHSLGWSVARNAAGVYILGVCE